MSIKLQDKFILFSITILVIALFASFLSTAMSQQNIVVQVSQQAIQNQTPVYPFPSNGALTNTGNNNSGYFVQTTQNNSQISTQSIATTPVNTTPTVHIYLDKPVLTGNMAIYQPGERILITAQLSSPGFLYLFNINSAGQTVQLYPNEFDRDNFISNTQSITIPRNAQYAFTIEGPNGIDSIVAIASQRSLQGNQITFGDINNLSSAVQATRPASYWSSDLAQIQVGFSSFAAVQSPIISTQTIPNQSDMTQGTIYMTPLGSTGNTTNAIVDLGTNTTTTNSNTGTTTSGTTTTSYPAYCSYAQYNSRSECAGATITNSTTSSSTTTTTTNATTSSSYPAYCSTPANQNRPECGGATTSTNTTSTNTASTSTSSANTSMTSSYPQYCSYAQYNSRTECAGAPITNSANTSTTTSTNASTTTSSYPAYCSTAANSNRTECGGSGQTQTVTTQQPATTSYPQYCSYAQYNSRTECAGAPITNSANTSTTTSTNASTTTSSYPTYCSTVANSYRTECGGSGQTQTVTTQQPASTNYPQYCSYAQYNSRTECAGAPVTNTSSSTSTSTTSASSYPAYCSNTANSNRTECGGSGQAQTTNTVTTTNTNTTTSSMPGYCASAANFSRPECGGTGNTSTSSGFTTTPSTTNTATVGSSQYPANTPIGVWQRLGAINYSYLITRNCRCPEVYRRPLYVTVQNGNIITAMFTDNQSNASAEIIQSVPTLDELMQFALQFSQSASAAVQAEYDINYGFPTSIFLDSNTATADDEVAYTISGFQIN